MNIFFREIILVQLFGDNFLSHTYIMFLFYFSIALIFVSIPIFLCKFRKLLLIVPLSSFARWFGRICDQDTMVLNVDGIKIHAF